MQTPEYLFHEEHSEVHSIGYILATELVPGPDIGAGMVAAVECNAPGMLSWPPP